MSILNLNEDHIFSKMKECFQEAGLPVFMDPCLCDNNPNKLRSLIIKGDLSIHIDGSYDTVNQFMKVRFCFVDPIDLKDLAAARLMINSMNAHLPLYHYSLCSDCNSLEIKCGFFAPATKLSKKKFKIILSDILAEIYVVYPLMIQTIRSGGNFSDLQDALKNRNGSSAEKNNGSGDDVLNRKKLTKTLKVIEQVLKKKGMLSQEVHLKDNRFSIPGIAHDKNEETKALFGVSVNNRGYIVLSMSPSEKVPDEKMISVMDLINRLNGVLAAEHLWIDRKTNDIVVMKGIVLADKVLDRSEFEGAVQTLLIHGTVMIETVLEHIASGQQPQTMVDHLFAFHSDDSHNCKKTSSPDLTEKGE